MPFLVDRALPEEICVVRIGLRGLELLDAHAEEHVGFVVAGNVHDEMLILLERVDGVQIKESLCLQKVNGNFNTIFSFF